MAVETLSASDAIGAEQFSKMTTISIDVEDPCMNKPENELLAIETTPDVDELAIELHTDYDDPSMYSPEISRHSLEQAHRRARVLEEQLREEAEAEALSGSSTALSISQKVASIAEGVAVVVKKVSRFSYSNEPDYSPLNQSALSASSSGDGIELKSDKEDNDVDRSSTGSGQVRRSVLKQVDEKETKPSTTRSRKGIRWCEDIEEMETLNGDDDSKQRRPKGMIRRLSAAEKEALYSLRPDLRIIPNWAQKYRDEMMQDRDGQSNACIIAIIICLLGILVFCLVVIILSVKRTPQTRLR